MILISSSNDAIIDVTDVVAVESTETMNTYKVITKPTTWYGTKIEAFQWLYQQSLLYSE
jgi:hypothetical protein